MRKQWLGTIILVLCGFVPSLWAKETAYLTLAETPDAGIYLPAPPDTVSVHFATDMWTWQFGKTLRPTARGEQASKESMWSAEEMMRILSEALETTVSDKRTPAIARYVRRLTATAHWAPYAAKEKYMRVRPYARMNEHLTTSFDDEDKLRHNGSYPSGHTSLGWLVALGMAEVAPERADTILRRGFQYGEDRWIVGAHWRSDVQAGYLCSSATWARAHANPIYYEDLTAARKEWRKISRSPLTSQPSSLPLPDGLRIMETPVDTASFLYYDDIMGYYEGKALRSSAAGQKAIQGAAKKTKDLMRYFSPATDITISKEETPALYALLDYGHEYIKRCVRSIKSRHPRKRPFLQFGEPSLIPELEKGEGVTESFPSGHSARGWGFALMLAEVMPDCSNALFATGYEYGYNRVVAGYHYLSDVQAARLVAAYAVAYLHTDAEFCRLMEEAKKEYLLKKNPPKKEKKDKHSAEYDSSGFVNLTDIVPDAVLEIRYYSTYNFVGERIDGYKKPVALITRRAADSLRAVSDELIAMGYRLKIWDAYRPQTAVNHFIRWAENVTDTAMKAVFYPMVDKSRLFAEGYIAARSSHSRGSTVDLTLLDAATGKELDMGSPFDWFGNESHPDYVCPLQSQMDNRLILRNAMIRHGFEPLDSEWWHFTLSNEPYPDTYFDFSVKPL